MGLDINAVLDLMRERAGATVQDLRPGDEVVNGIFRGVFVAQTEHPLYPGLRLVVWKLPEGSGLPGDWSHDALDARQVVGFVTPSSQPERVERLRRVLHGGG